MSGFATPPIRRPSPAASSTAPMRNLGYSPPPCLSKHPIILIPSRLRCEGKYVHASQSDLRKRPKKVYAHIATGCIVAVAARRTVEGQFAPEGPVAQSRSGCAFYVERFQNRDADRNRANTAASAQRRLNWPSEGERDPWKRSPREAIVATWSRIMQTLIISDL